MQSGHLTARGVLVEAGLLEGFGLDESLIDQAENVGPVALPLHLAAGDLGLDELGHALLQVADLVGCIQKLRGYRDAGYNDLSCHHTMLWQGATLPSPVCRLPHAVGLPKQGPWRAEQPVLRGGSSRAASHRAHGQKATHH